MAQVHLGTDEDVRDGFPCLPFGSLSEGQLETLYCMSMVSMLDSDLKGPFFCPSLCVSVHVCAGVCTYKCMRRPEVNVRCPLLLSIFIL